MSFDIWHNLVAKTLKSNNIDEALYFKTKNDISCKALHIPSDVKKPHECSVYYGTPMEESLCDYSLRLSGSTDTTREIIELCVQDNHKSFVLENNDVNKKTLDFNNLLKNLHVLDLSIRLRGYNTLSISQYLCDPQKTQQSAPKTLHLDTSIEEAQHNKDIFLSCLQSSQIEKIISCYVDKNHDLSDFSDIGLIVAQIVDYLRLIEELGQDKRKYINKFTCILSHDEDFYHNIAKTRALRHLWHFVLHTCDIKTTHDPIHIVDSYSSIDGHDNATDILRLTSVCMTALLNNVNHFDLALIPLSYPTQNHSKNEKKDTHQQDISSYRLLKNIPLITYHEADIGKIQDPMAGSYMIENYTHRLIEKAYTDFQTIEKHSGYRHFINAQSNK